MNHPQPPAAHGMPIHRKARMYQLLADHEDRHANGDRLPKHEHEELHELLAEAGGHVYPGRIPMTDAEHTAVDKLLARQGEQAMLTRRDPGNTGPLLVIIGDLAFEVAPNGRTKKVAG